MAPAMYKKMQLVFTRAAAILVVLCGSFGLFPSRAAAGVGLGLMNHEERYLDVIVDDKVAVRYMYAYDNSTPERLNETYKPYLHVFDAEGKNPITKGAGGEYPHHRGIYVGWNKIRVGDKAYDRWHMKGGEIVHQRFLGERNRVDNGVVTFAAVNHWNDENGKPLLVEERTFAVRPGQVRGQGPWRLLVDVTSKLTATDADVVLDGDPEHAGVHYRPADDLDRQQTVYVYPRENAKPHADVDYDWVGMSYTLKDSGKRYSVVQMSHPDNPKGARWSAYRNYGRFGAFPKGTIAAGKSFVVRYRFAIADGEMPAVDAVHKTWAEFAGVGEQAPAAPKVTVLPAEQPKPKEPAKNTGAKPQAAIEGREPSALASTAPTTRAVVIKRSKTSNTGPKDVQLKFELPPPAPLKAEEALKTFELPAGLRIEAVAAEPMVQEPVAISFDHKGRMYVVEMRGYMLDVEATGEEDPTGRIKRLEDTDGDGRFDKATVFLDKLVMPRAVMAYRDGAIVGVPPELAYWEDVDDDGRADKKTVIATNYGTEGGQPEHMANTPMYAIDNWIYSAGHEARYREVRGQWTAMPTDKRGQWGLAQDDYGRFYFSTNSDVARADPLPADYFLRNPYYRARDGRNVGLMDTQDVWPSHPTPGVNRGYQEKQLRDDGTLATATAAGGSTVYRGGLLPAEYAGNLFTPEPSGNLIKRMVVTESGGKLAAKNAYEGREFLTSTDERFRPVFMCTGPDGALYVVDMYKGVLQHYYYLTHYLIKNIKQRDLEDPDHWGRIYRIVPERNAPPPAKLPTELAALVESLGHANGWVRDTAQRRLVERNDRAAVPLLRKAIAAGATPLARLHALWTLEGTGRLDEAAIRSALRDPDAKVRAAAVRVAEPLLAPTTRPQMLPALLKIAGDAAPEVQLQLALSLGAIPEPPVEEMLAVFLAGGIAADPDLMRDAVLSSLRGRELEFTERLLAHPQWSSPSPSREQMLTELARCVMAERRSSRVARLLDVAAGEPEGSWRQLALLTGMAPKVDPKSGEAAPVGKLIYLGEQPEALTSLLTSNATPVSELAKRVDPRLAWPGKPGVPPPPKITPLTPEQQARFERGREVYAQTCAACHQASGVGQEGLAPPLADSEWVVGSPERLVRVVLQGLTGPISVNGVPYKMEMPGLSALPDEDIAAVLTYIRREWDHTADPIDERLVSVIREKTGERAELWTAKELQEFK